jgi:predicted SnoaL-like aldol condensation-catalyzing enzyme
MNRVIPILLVSAIVLAGCSHVSGVGVLERNKELVRRAHVEVWSRGNLKAIDEIYAPDYVAHWVGGPDSRGRDRFKQFVADAYRRAPDRNETVDQIVAEGDLVVTRFTTRGTFASPPGEPPQRKQITLQEIAIHRIRDGKIVEQWTVEGVMDVKVSSAEAAP